MKTQNLVPSLVSRSSFPSFFFPSFFLTFFVDCVSTRDCYLPQKGCETVLTERTWFQYEGCLHAALQLPYVFFFFLSSFLVLASLSLPCRQLFHTDIWIAFPSNLILLISSTVPSSGHFAVIERKRKKKTMLYAVWSVPSPAFCTIRLV